MKKTLFLVCVLVFLLVACTSTKVADKQDENLFIPPVGGMSVSVGKEIFCDFNGTIIKEYAKMPPVFDDCFVTVLSTNMNYYYSGEKALSLFELVYVNVKPEKYGLTKKNELIGKATKDNIGIFIRAKELDRYLISISHTMPLFWNDYWYYYAGMLDASHMKFLDFLPLETEVLKEIYEGSKEVGNMAEINLAVLLKTSLQEMPKLSPDGTGTQIINHEGMVFSLTWQKGFYSYLENEYNLNDEIYLYVNMQRIVDYKGVPCFVCYVRDFSLVPPEEIVEDRIQTVLANMK